MARDLAILHTVSAYARTRWLTFALRTPADVARYQRKRIRRLIAHAVQSFPAYRDHAGATIDQLPQVDKAKLLADFASYNAGGLTADAVRGALARGEERIGEHLIGQSTGTSGNRGYYVISEAERFTWLGVILAKTLPDAIYRRHRVALAMPGMSRLYASASAGSRIQLAFFDLALGIDAWADKLVTFAPDTIVAPPKVLRALAERGQLTAQRIFSGAEVLDPLDRAAIEAATGAVVREIYMATEGLFGVSCPHGLMHLAQDAVHFEWAPAAPDSALVMPIVTDFTRRAQAMIRYRMNDLLELSAEPCRCGSPLQAVSRIEGRADDMLLLPRPNGELAPVTPDVARNAIVDSHPSIKDFRVVQSARDGLVVCLEEKVPSEAVVAAKAALERAFARMGLAPVVIEIVKGILVPYDRKLRRVRREWAPPRA